MRKWFFLILVFISASFSYSQEDAVASIKPISFKENLIYSPGSGISVHFDPKGIYKLGDESNLGVNAANNNAFILELSEEGGSFANPTQLETLYDFYTPLINSNLPSNLSPGDYKLRIRATLGYSGDPNGWSLESNDYSEVVYEFEQGFQVQNQNINSEISITSSFPSNDNYINCLNDSDLPSPFIGSMSQSIGSTTAIVSTVNYLQFNINGYDNDNTYEITLYDYYNDSNQILNQGAGPGFYEIPDDLEIGTYTIEVVETLPNNISNVISFSFLWHSNATALNNQTSESVCIGEDVIFSIPTNDDGIARNYFGSYYKIDFGDGSNIILTHNAILHQNSFFHQFEGASCNIEGSNLYEIEESLYNKYEDCDSYTVNGEGAVKFVDASAPPAPQFNINQQQCINPQAPENVEVINTTQTGEWTTENSPDCQTDLISYWSVRPPGFDDFVSVNDFFPTWITDLNNDGLSDLDIPYSEIDDPGCWDFELVAINGNNVICSSTVVASGTIDMLELPVPSFILQDEEGNEVSQICPGDVVNIIDTSNLSDVEQEDCQSVTYDWTISGAQYVNGTGTNTQNPSVIFNNPGIYEIHLSLGNGICPSVKFNIPDFIVQGTPTVSLNDSNNGSNEVVCSDSLPYIVDFNSTFTPAYSTDPYTPTAFLWEISGDNDDYIFINSTDSGSPYPIVQFNSFGCYTISNTVNGDCDNASNDSFTLSLTANPDVDFDFQDSAGNEVNQVCPGDVISLIDNSTVDGSGCQDVQYSWSINGTTNYNYETGNSNSQNPSISFSDPGSYEITLQVNNGSCATDTLTQTINIEGTPSVNINPVGGDSEQICMDSSDIPYVIDFSSSYTPEYSDGVFTPANYSWEISGDDISASDYSFINSSSSSSIYPTIQFNSFGCYTITNTVTGNCGTSSSDSFTISLDQNPVANFEILNTLGQVVDQICPGDIVQLHDLSDVNADGCDPVEYQWGISALIPGTPAGHCVPAQASTWTDPSPYIEFNEPGIFEVSVQVTVGNCPVSTISQEIVVEGPPSVDINVNGPDSDQICLLDSELPYQINFADTYTPEYSDSVYTPSSYLWVISGDGVTADDYTFLNSSTSELPIIQFNSFKDFTITTTVGGNCDVTASDEFQISFNQIPELSNNNMSQIVCSGESTEEIIFDSNVAETNYSWSFTSADTYLSGYDQQGTGNFSVQNIINSNNISGQVEFSVTPSTSDCEGTPQTFTITVNPEPSIDNIEQEICTGSGISITPTDGTIPVGTTYSWDAPTSSPSGVITGGNSGTDETTITESELLNSTNSPAVLTYSVTPTTPDGCTGDPFTVSVTVNPLGQVDNPGDQEFCNNDNISINFTTDNTGGDTTYSWTNTNSAIGLSNSGSGNINVTATNTTNDAITSTVTVTPSFEGCEGTPQTFTITVNPAPQLDDPSDQVIFTGESTTPVTLTSSVNGVTYSWSANEPTGNLIGLSQSSGTSNQIPSETLVNDTSGPLVLTYTITPILEGVDCDAVPEEYTITINPPVTMLSIDDQVVCNGDDVNVNFESANSGGSTTFEWTNDTPGIGLATSGSGDLPSFTAINNGLSPIVATVTVTPTFENGGISSEGDSQTFTITVNPTAQVNAVENQILCDGSDTLEVNFSTNLNSNQSSVDQDGNSFAFVTLGTQDWSAEDANVTTYRDGTAIPLETADGSFGYIETGAYAYYENNSANGTKYYNWYAVQGIHDNDATTENKEFAPEGWRVPTEDDWQILVAYLVANGYNYDGDTTPYPNWSHYSDYYGNKVGKSMASTTGWSNNSYPNGGGMAVTDQPPFYGVGVPGNNQSANNSTGLNMEPFGGFEIQAAGGFNEWDPHGFNAYYWSSDLENDPGENAWAGKYAVLNYVDPSLNIHGHTLDIERKRAHRVRFVRDNNQIIASGTTTYSWVNDTPSIGLASSGTGDIASFAAVNNSTSPVTATITVTPTYTNEGISCDGPTETFTITVNPTAQVDDPQDQIICNGETTSVEFTTENTGGTTTYAWTNDTPSIGLADLGTGNIASFAGVNEGTSPVVATLTVTPTFTENGISCTGPAETFTITVNPTGQVDAIDSQILCNADETAAITFSTENTGGTTTYAWTNDTPSIGLASSGNGDIGSFNVVNNGNEPVTATVVVTPSFEGCTGPTETFTITVNPTAEMNDPEDMVVCNAEVTDAVEFTTDNTGGTTTYTWTNDTPAIGLAATGSGDLPSFTAINTGTEPIVAIVVVTPLFTDDINCDGISQTFTITVNPSAQVDEPNDQVLCNGDSILVEFTTQNTIGNTTYTWTSDIDFGNGLAGSGNIDFNVVNNGTFPTVATVTVIPIIENLGVSCSGPIQTFTVTVNGNVDDQEDISNYNGFEISCFEANDGYINLNPIGGTPYQAGSEYVYSWTGPNGFTSSEQNISELAPGTYIVNITDSLDCSFEFEYEINEPDPLEIIVDEQSDVQCNGIFDGIISISPQGGAAPYTYEWTKDGVFFSNEQNIDNLEPGTYVVFLNDANLCGPVSQIFEIVQPDPIEISLENSVDILCFGENTGSIDINVIGGTPEQISTEVTQYNYLWIGPNGYTSNQQDIDNLFAGIYTVTVSDSLGCEEIFEVELTQPDDLIINYTTTDNSCYESDDGTITLDIQGGVEPYQIFWSNFGNGPTQTNLSAGIYEVTVIDAHDCEEVVNIEIIEAPIFDTNPVQTNISCFGETDGSINLNITGGIAPIFVTWDDDPTAGEERNNLGPGTYNVLIEDSSGNNCTISHEFIIIEPQELILNAVVTNPLDCDNVNSGSIDLQVVGGTEPYTFLWSNGAVTEDLNDIPAGNYSVSVTDFMGCEVLDQFDLIRPSDLETNLIIDFTADCENGIPSQITTLEVSGGVPPYNIVWSDGDVSGDIGEIMTTSQNGTYVIDITDSLGCTDQILFDVDLFELGSPGFTYDSNGLMLCDSIGVNDLVQFTNTSTGDYTNLIWNFGDGTPLVEGVENPEHTYLYEGTYEITLTVEYPYGCSYTFSETIGVTEGYGLVLPNTFTPNGDGINDTIRPWYKCMSSIEVSIYDTFGSLLYVESSTGEIYGWDGLINGRPAENGNYIIVVRAVSLYGQEIELNGPVTLVR